jgi:hypothetical protein
VIGTESKKPAEWTREFLPMDRNSAIAYLTGVVNDLLSTGNDYFLPIEAVEKVAKQMDDGKKPRDQVDTVEQVLLNDPPKCSSDYGPVRNARDFDPPEEEKIEAIVHRRFSPITGIFK